MSRCLLLLAAFLMCVASSAGTARAVEDEERLLIALVTWGPEPYSATHAEAVLAETASFVGSASFGRIKVVGDTTPWLHALASKPTQCDPLEIMQTANSALTRAGYDRPGNTRVVYSFPRFEACPWGGAYFGGHVQLNGRMDRQVLAHELGHLYGVPEEGPAWVCSAGRCRQENYESPYSVMGHGLGDYSAYEKHIFGWIDSGARPETNGTYALSAIDRPSVGPHALHVLIAGDEYWFEYRSPAPRWDPDEPTARPGLVVYGGPHQLDKTPSTFPVRNLLIRDPVGTGSPAIGVGDGFRAPGAFELNLTAMGADGAETSFRWLDRTPPTAVRILQPASSTVGATPLVRWEPPRERGSGVGAYEIRVDGRLTRTLPAARALDTALVAAPLYLRLGRLASGPHRVAIVAVDRAGNRSLPARRRFVVRG